MALCMADTLTQLITDSIRRPRVYLDAFSDDKCVRYDTIR